MRLVFVTLFQNSNPEGNKKDLISCGKMGNVELKKKEEDGCSQFTFSLIGKATFGALSMF